MENKPYQKITDLSRNSNIDKNNGGYFLKGDISGIQDFIFSVKSKRASRTLKGRSFFVHTLSDICIKRIEHELGI